jgi:hypothetical protein
MRRIVCGVVCVLVMVAVGCGSGSGSAKSGQELDAMQNKDQQQADEAERALPRKSHKR